MKFDILLLFLLQTLAAAEKCPFSETVNITKGFKDSRKNIIHKSVFYRPENYEYYDYIIDNKTSIKVNVDRHIRGCICKVKKCIRICCQADKIMDENSGRCVDYRSTKLSANYTRDGKEFEYKVLNRSFAVIYGRPCQDLVQLLHLDYEDEKWVLWQNSSITIANANQETLGYNDYCLSNVITENYTMMGTFAFRCFNVDVPDTRSKVYFFGLLFSVPFLLITFLVYAFVPELRNLHGKNVMSYVFSLTLSFILLAVMNSRSVANEEHFKIGVLCKTIGYLFYFFILTSFFWLNIMSYDIWKTITRSIRDKRKDAELRKYFKYALYAFGLPLVIVINAFCVDHVDWMPDDLKPNIGDDSCFFSSKHRLNWFIYFHLPLLFILISNIAMYGDTAYHIYKVETQTKVLRTGENQTHMSTASERERFSVYLRLFIAMGVTWSMESLAWIFKDNSYIFYLTDFWNSLQGIIIFLLFIWKPKVRGLICKRFRSSQVVPS